MSLSFNCAKAHKHIKGVCALATTSVSKTSIIDRSFASSEKNADKKIGKNSSVQQKISTLENSGSEGLTLFEI